MNQNKQVLIEYLLNYAFKHGIGYMLVKANPDDPSLSFKKSNMMFINTNWRNSNEVPFSIAHEIGHLILGEQGIMYYSSFSGQNSEEKAADDYGLQLIFDYACKNEQFFEEPGDFIQAYGIPQRMLNSAKKLFEDNNDLI